VLTVLCIPALGQEQTTDYWLQKGNEYYIKQSYELAEKCYDKVIELDSKNVSAWSMKGLTLAQLNKYNESNKAFDVALDIAPKNADVWIKNGLALYTMIDIYKELEVNDISLGYLHPINNYKFIENLEGSVGPKGKWEYAFNISNEGIAAVLNKPEDKYNELLLVLEDPHGLPSDAALGTGNLGPVVVFTPEIGRWKVRVYGYNVSSKNVAFHIDISLIDQSYLLDRYNESITAFDKAIELNPKSTVALNYKASALFDFHKINESIELIDKSLDIDPLNAWTWWKKGTIFESQNKTLDALQYFNNAIDLDPSFAQAWLDKSGILASLGRVDEANAASRKWAELLGSDKTLVYSN